jgi:hypothetical protein
MCLVSLTTCPTSVCLQSRTAHGPRIWLPLANYLALSHVQVLQGSVVLYESLNLSKEQKHAMRNLWWRVAAHRAALNARYTSCADIIARIASAASPPPSFVRRLLTLCLPGSSSVVAQAAPHKQAPMCGSSARTPEAAQHAWAQCALGASAQATAAASAALQGLWDCLEEEAGGQGQCTWMAYTGPCMTEEQAARFLGGQLARGAFSCDGLRNCQLATLELGHSGLLKERARLRAAVL